MGRFADKAKEIKQRNEGNFQPLELCEVNVQAIFNRCFATIEDATDDITSSKLFQQDMGYDEDSKPVFFNKTKIEKNKKNILYLLGQLKITHDNLAVTAANAIYRYDGVKWTTDTVTLMELYHLGESSKGMHPFVKRSNQAEINTVIVTPTFSPKDPVFSKWWEAHKAEWEDL